MGRRLRRVAACVRRDGEDCFRISRKTTSIARGGWVLLAIASLSGHVSFATAANVVATKPHNNVRKVSTERAHRGGEAADGWSDQEDCVVVVTWEEEGPEGSGKREVRMVERTSRKAWRHWWKNPFRWNDDDSDGRPGPPSPTQDTDILSESTDRLRNRLSASESARARVLQDEPHPLRTDAWQLRLHWRKRRFVFDHPPTLLLDFDPAGYVRCRRPVETANYNRNDDSTQPPETRVYGSIGTWELTPTGLSWTIGLDDDEIDDDDNGIAAFKARASASASASHSSVHPPIRNARSGTGVYLFHADLHLHPFGPRPRLSRGVVLHEKGSIGNRGANKSSRWFRPVVATFSGVGIGRDTVDLSYRGRRRR